MRADQDRVGSPQSPVLTVRDLTTVAETRRGTARLLNRVSFDLHRGETLGLVGESGLRKEHDSPFDLTAEPNSGHADH